MGEYLGSRLLLNGLNEFTMDGEKYFAISSLFISDNLA
jgi:hypothetical protein